MTQQSWQPPHQLAENEVKENYPRVYRAEDDLRNHAFARAQDQVQRPTGEAHFTVQDYAEAYMRAYRRAVEQQDAKNL